MSSYAALEAYLRENDNDYGDDYDAIYGDKASIARLAMKKLGVIKSTRGSCVHNDDNNHGISNNISSSISGSISGSIGGSISGGIPRKETRISHNNTISSSNSNRFAKSSSVRTHNTRMVSSPIHSNASISSSIKAASKHPFPLSHPLPSQLASSSIPKRITTANTLPPSSVLASALPKASSSSASQMISSHGTSSMLPKPSILSSSSTPTTLASHNVTDDDIDQFITRIQHEYRLRKLRLKQALGYLESEFKSDLTIKGHDGVSDVIDLDKDGLPRVQDDDDCDIDVVGEDLSCIDDYIGIDEVPPPPPPLISSSAMPGVSSSSHRSSHIPNSIRSMKIIGESDGDQRVHSTEPLTSSVLSSSLGSYDRRRKIQAITRNLKYQYGFVSGSKENVEHQESNYEVDAATTMDNQNLLQSSNLLKEPIISTVSIRNPDESSAENNIPVKKSFDAKTPSSSLMRPNLLPYADVTDLRNSIEDDAASGLSGEFLTGATSDRVMPNDISVGHDPVQSPVPDVLRQNLIATNNVVDCVTQSPQTPGVKPRMIPVTPSEPPVFSPNSPTTVLPSNRVWEYKGDDHWLREVSNTSRSLQSKFDTVEDDMPKIGSNLRAGASTNVTVKEERSPQNDRKLLMAKYQQDLQSLRDLVNSAAVLSQEQVIGMLKARGTHAPVVALEPQHCVNGVDDDSLESSSFPSASDEVCSQGVKIDSLPIDIVSEGGELDAKRDSVLVQPLSSNSSGSQPGQLDADDSRDIDVNSMLANWDYWLDVLGLENSESLYPPKGLGSSSSTPNFTTDHAPNNHLSRAPLPIAKSRGELSNFKPQYDSTQNISDIGIGFLGDRKSSATMDHKPARIESSSAPRGSSRVDQLPAISVVASDDGPDSDADDLAWLLAGDSISLPSWNLQMSDISHNADAETSFSSEEES